MRSSHNMVKRFNVIQGNTSYKVCGYAAACQKAIDLMLKNKQPVKVEVEFTLSGWGMQQELELSS